MQQPKLSIITVNLNNAEGLRKTIESVVSQKFTDYEYIIIDGGSNDGSVDIIKQYADKITYWVSEPDKGIYNAMNKGIKVAKGEYCQFLNSGDLLIDKNVVSKVFELNRQEDILYGNLKTINSDYTFPEVLSLNTFIKGTIPHNASFIKLDLFKKIGFYNISLKICSDWEFFLKAIILNNCSYKYLNFCITLFDTSGISMNENNLPLIQKERNMVFNNLIPRIYNDFIFLEKMNTELTNKINHINQFKIIKILRKINIKKK